MSESGSFATGLQFPRVGDFAETEDALRQFYRSGEAETTTSRSFPSFHCTLVLRESENSGVGLFLEERVVPGQLLILDQAISSCKCTRHCTLSDTDTIGPLPNADSLPLSTRIPPTVEQHLVYHLARKMTTCDTTTLAQMTMLDAHERLQPPSETLDNHKITQQRLSTAAADSVVLDLEELKNIVSNNAMCDKGRFLNLNEPRQVETFEQWGVWLIPSWINHSCSPNCHRMRIGDAMIIRAAKPIADGEELTLPYFDIFQPLHSREIHCSKFFFRCECTRCTFERSIGERYENIQKKILRLTAEMHAVKRSDQVRSGFTQLLLKRLMDVGKEVDILIDELACEGKFRDPIMKKPNEQNLPGRSQDDVLPMHSPESTSQVVLADVLQYWIQASFIEVHIAAYALCTAGFFYIREHSYPFGRLVHWRETHTSDSNKNIIFSLRIVAAAERILPIIDQVHPGNMLGQEFYTILLCKFADFVQEDEYCNLHPNALYLRKLERKVLRSLGAYFGFAGGEILREKARNPLDTYSTAEEVDLQFLNRRCSDFSTG